MGDWRRAKIIGTCGAEDVHAARQHVEINMRVGNAVDWDRFGALSSVGGLAGLPVWPAEVIDAMGNLAERGYDEESVQEYLEELALIAPSLRCCVHLGKAYESSECEATIELGANGVAILPPQVEQVAEASVEQMQGNFRRQMGY